MCSNLKNNDIYEHDCSIVYSRLLTLNAQMGVCWQGVCVNATNNLTSFSTRADGSSRLNNDEKTSDENAAL